jgi:hypothetical protein
MGVKLFYNHWHKTDEFSYRLLPYIYPHIGQIPSAGTVGNMAVMLAIILGCKKIAMVGMDLCYAKTSDGGWRYRCQDYVYDQATQWTAKENTPLYDNDERVSRSFLKPMGTVSAPDIRLKEGSKELAYRTDPELAVYAQSLLDISKSYPTVELSTCSTWNIFASEGDTIKSVKLPDWVEKNCKKGFQDGKTIVWSLTNLLDSKGAIAGRAMWR